MSDTFVCTHCGEQWDIEDRHSFDGAELCPDCFHEETVVCEHCGRRIWADNAVDSDRVLCEGCYEDYYVNCEGCGRTLHNDDAYYFDDGNDYPYCHNCYEQRCSGEYIHDYSFKPEPIFYGDGNRYFGVELEIDEGGHDDGNAEKLTDIANTIDEKRIYIKHDGSLNDGVDFAESSNTSVEMQLNENKQTNMQQICSLFCTPYDIITGKASSETQKQWVKNCIIPLLNVVEAAVDSDLLTEAEKESRYFAFDTAELTRGDFKERMEGYAVALQNNILDIDEVRAKEDYPPRGFNFMKLGLQDVLLDLKTNRIYTPNTNQFQDLGAVISGDKIMPAVADERAYIQDPKTGRMMGRTPEKGLTSKEINDRIEADRSDLRTFIQSGQVVTKLNKTAQSKHRKGSEEYERVVANGNKPSFITVSNMEVQQIINQKSTTGKVHKAKDGQFRETIDCGKIIGEYVDLNTGKSFETSRATIHYSKKGTHIVPTIPEKKGNNNG